MRARARVCCVCVRVRVRVRVRACVCVCVCVCCHEQLARCFHRLIGVVGGALGPEMKKGLVLRLPWLRFGVTVTLRPVGYGLSVTCYVDIHVLADPLQGS